MIIYNWISQSFKRKIVAGFLIAALIPLLLSNTYFYFRTSLYLHETVHENLKNAAELTSDNIDSFVSLSLNYLTSISQSEDTINYFMLEGANREKIELRINQFFRSLNNNEFEAYLQSYILVDNEMTVIYDYSQIHIGEEYTSPEIFQETKSLNVPLVSIDWDNNSILFTSNVRNFDGNALGIIQLRYNLEVINYVARKTDNLVGDESFSIITDSSGVPLSGGVDIDLSEVKETELEFSGASLINSILTNLDYSVYQTISERAGLQVYYLKTEESIRQFNNEQQSVQLFIFSFTAVLTFFLAILIVGRSVGSINKLIKVAKEYGKGNWKRSFSIDSSDEIGDLSRTLNTMAEQIADQYEELENAYLQTALSLARVIDARDSYTSNHSQRMADLADSLAEKLNLSDIDRWNLSWACQLHDVGKISIPDKILRKPGKLDDVEWEIMKTHPEIGEEIIGNQGRLAGVSKIVGSHHEKFDGSGYPKGLKGTQIPMGSRIITLVDSFGAMLDNRVYRKGMKVEDALEEVKRCSGTHFDPQVVEVFFSTLEEEVFLEFVNTSA